MLLALPPATPHPQSENSRRRHNPQNGGESVSDTPQAERAMPLSVFYVLFISAEPRSRSRLGTPYEKAESCSKKALVSISTACRHEDTTQNAKRNAWAHIAEKRHRYKYYWSLCAAPKANGDVLTCICISEAFIKISKLGVFQVRGKGIDVLVLIKPL